MILNKIREESKYQCEEDLRDQLIKFFTSKIISDPKEIRCELTITKRMKKSQHKCGNKNNTQTTPKSNPRILCEDTKQRQKFTSKTRCSWYSRISHSKKPQNQNIYRINLYQTTIIYNSSSMISRIYKTYKQKLCTRNLTMRYHKKNTTLNTQIIITKQTQSSSSLMTYRTICYYLFLIYLSKCTYCSINYTQRAQHVYLWFKIFCTIRKQWYIKSYKTIRTHFLQYSSQYNTTYCRTFCMSNNQPRMKWYQWLFYNKCYKKTQPYKIIQQIRILWNSFYHRYLICCTICQIQILYTYQLKQRSCQCIQYKTIRCIYFSIFTTIQTNINIHWYQYSFKGYIKIQYINNQKDQYTQQTNNKNKKNTLIIFWYIQSRLIQNQYRHQHINQPNKPLTNTINSKIKKLKLISYNIWVENDYLIMSLKLILNQLNYYPSCITFYHKLYYSYNGYKYYGQLHILYALFCIVKKCPPPDIKDVGGGDLEFI